MIPSTSGLQGASVCPSGPLLPHPFPRPSLPTQPSHASAVLLPARLHVLRSDSRRRQFQWPGQAGHGLPFQATVWGRPWTGSAAAPTPPISAPSIQGRSNPRRGAGVQEDQVPELLTSVLEAKESDSFTNSVSH